MGFEIGMSGSVTWPGTQANLVRWAANIQRDVHDGTVMVPTSDGNYSWRRRILGHGHAAGTIEFLVDPTWSADDYGLSDTAGNLGKTAPGVPSVLTLKTSSAATASFTGSVLLSGFSVTAEVDGINRTTCDFVSDGRFDDGT